MSFGYLHQSFVYVLRLSLAIDYLMLLYSPRYMNLLYLTTMNINDKRTLPLKE